MSRIRGAGRVLGCLVLAAVIGSFLAPCQADELVERLRGLDARVIVRGKVRQPPLATMLASDVQARLHMANRVDARAWDLVRTRADWERFRAARLAALRSALGEFPPVPRDLKVRSTGRHEGDGYQVDNLVFESRPGLIVTANLYRPAKPTASMPGLLICHSHHQPKHTGARQDMGMTWARAGCVVLVPDLLGNGERRQHPFGSATDSAPHDYHFRYDTGIQLHLIGESLMGWLAWDVMRGVDLLLAQPGIDPKRIVVISEPAGGGDVAAVAAALDSRITGVMVNNFGGPEPETSYPLPRDAEESFDYAGSGSWESTRNLRLSARDGFLPWVIVASAAPRSLIYYHEFFWDREHDPVWKRLQKVHALYDAPDSLTGLAGRGFVVGTEPENTHWLPINREVLYPVLERWFHIPNPRKEYSQRRPAEELLCLTPELRKEVQPLHRLAARRGTEQVTAARAEFARLLPGERRDRLRQGWTRLLGDVAPRSDPIVRELTQDSQPLGTVSVTRIHLCTEPGIVVPVLLLVPPAKEGKLSVVIGLAQEGKQEFLRHRAEAVAKLLREGVAVCLPDLRGCGETSPGEARDRRSAATSISASEWMLGQSVLGGRLRDLRAVIRHLRHRPQLDTGRLLLWGDSFATVNPPDRDLQVPHASSTRPAQAEPLGGLLALLIALFEDDVRAVFAQGGLSDYQSVLQGQFCYLPHDAIVPGILTIGDLPETAVALAPRPLWLAGLVDGHNQEVSAKELARRYDSARAVYGRLTADRLRVSGKPREEEIVRWLTTQARAH